VFEYAPRRIKQALTGMGGAAKEQVAIMLQKMLGIEYDVKKLDATDGLAVAVCHHFISSSPVKQAITRHKEHKSSSWEAFVADHPDKIKKNI
jgi:crossover junction endodeoxyribonuclease RuvC